MWTADAVRLGLYARLLQRTTWPILVGPFRSEVGFEVLYWLPFLARLQKRYGLDPQRFVPLTRGGAKAWYGGQDCVDLYDLRTPQQVRVETRYQLAATGVLKQLRVTDWDRAVVAEARRRMGLTRAHWLHPAWMYRLLDPWWGRERWGVRPLNDWLRLEDLPVPALPTGLALPDKFVAVRFYARYTLPPSDTTKTYVHGAVQQLAQQLPVVLLNTGLHLDDHWDWPLTALDGHVTRLTEYYTASNNLAVQSAVIARAVAFVGTHGGLAQLALRHKIPSVGFFTRWGGTAFQHRHLADLLAAQYQVPHYVLRLRDTDLVRAVLPAISMAASS